MIFGFGKRKKERPPEDPLAAYDALLEDLKRQGRELRKAAATLLALRGELSRDVDRNARRAEDLERRGAEARRKGQARAEAVLAADLARARRLRAEAEAALASAGEDARLLLEASEDLAGKIRELEAERRGASARLRASAAVTRALRERTERIDQVLALEAARDEVERAHALAEIYREQARDKG